MSTHKLKTKIDMQYKKRTQEKENFSLHLLDNHIDKPLYING